MNKRGKWITKPPRHSFLPRAFLGKIELDYCSRQRSIVERGTIAILPLARGFDLDADFPYGFLISVADARRPHTTGVVCPRPNPNRSISNEHKNGIHPKRNRDRSGFAGFHKASPLRGKASHRNDETVHVFYKYGRLEVWLRHAVKGTFGAYKWVTILNFLPEWLETELEIQRNWSEMR